MDHRKTAAPYEGRITYYFDGGRYLDGLEVAAFRKRVVVDGRDLHVPVFSGDYALPAVYFLVNDILDRQFAVVFDAEHQVGSGIGI